MVVVNTGTSIFSGKCQQATETVRYSGSGRTSDPHERSGAPVRWLSYEGQADVWQLFSDNSDWSAILDRQRFLVAAPGNLRRKKAESFSPQSLQDFWSKIKRKNPKIVLMSPAVFTIYTNQKKLRRQQYRLCFAIAEYQILDGKIPNFSSRIKNYLVDVESTTPS